MMKVSNEIVYKEDVLFDNSIIDMVSKVHGFKLVSYHRRRKIRGKEVDVYSLWTTRTRVKRSMLFELKQHNLGKLVEQAIKRIGLADYIYIIYEVSPTNTSIISNHSDGVDICKAIRRGIGIIYYPIFMGTKREPLLIYKAKYRKSYYYHL